MGIIYFYQKTTNLFTMDITEMDMSEFLEKEELQEHTAKLAANAEAFLASCGKLPIEIYRIEKFVPTL